LFLSRHGKNKRPIQRSVSEGFQSTNRRPCVSGEFLKTWKLHHELEPQQLNFANKIAKVKSVGFYHGGDELYELKGVPGTWHEQCLRAVEQVGFFRRFFKY
jgi:hypothetical protein